MATDDLYLEALSVVQSAGRASTKLLQDKMLIGYNRASTLIERMEKEGVVKPLDTSRILNTFK